MSIRKRAWTTASGQKREAWTADYVDQKGARHQTVFARKKEAEDFLTGAKAEVRAGTHIADSTSVSVQEAGKLWLAAAAADGLERSTLESYRQHLELHIAPLIGGELLSRLNAPGVRAFEDELRQTGRSRAMMRKIMCSLGALVADAQERGLASRNVVRDLRGIRKRGKASQAARRLKPKLKVGTHIPTRTEIKNIVGKLSGRWRPLLVTAVFTGMRASEIRGLRWEDVDLDAKVLHVRQRADRFNAIGPPKSEAGQRTIPLPPMVLNTLREWKLVCPKFPTGKKDAAGKPIKVLHFVFPNGAGRVESLANIINRGLMPAQVAAGVSIKTDKVDKDGNPVMKAKYTGMHALRHWFASWCINSVADGGQGLLPKTVQERLGHSSIVVTMDIYGHLFPTADDADKLAEAERTLLA